MRNVVWRVMEYGLVMWKVDKAVIAMENDAGDKRGFMFTGWVFGRDRQKCLVFRVFGIDCVKLNYKHKTS